GAHLRERLADALTVAALGKLTRVPGVELAHSAHDLLLAGGQIGANADRIGHGVAVVIAQVVGQIGEDPVFAVLAPPVSQRQRIEQGVEVAPDFFQLASERGESWFGGSRHRRFLSVCARVVCPPFEYHTTSCTMPISGASSIRSHTKSRLGS